MLAILGLAIQDAPDPYLLPIPKADSVEVRPGITRTSDGKSASFADIAATARGYRFVMVGESHDNPYQHQAQADVIEALVKDGRKVVVGFEMFTRDNQPALDEFNGKWFLMREFQEKTNWKTQWGFDFNLYRPIFESARRHDLPMSALNLPRDWVRQIGRQGPGILTAEQKKWAPDIALDNKNHRMVFEALMGGHPMTGPQAENIYAAQVSWDEGMATSAVDFMADKTGSEWVMVILAGSGHTMYGQGINYRLAKKGHKSLNVTCIASESPRPVSRGFADFVVVTKDVERSED